MGGQRGRIRLWRKKEEAHNKHCIRRRWKGFKQFMFWGCFSYDSKGPCHVWEDETKAQKKESKEWLEAENTRLEPALRAEWELVNGMRRLRATRNTPGKKPTWKWTEKNGKLVRNSSKGGINWYRYKREILESKLLPFARRELLSNPKTIV